MEQMEQMEEVLQSLDLHALITRFREERIDIKNVQNLNEKELSQLGVTTIGDRVLWNAMTVLCQTN